MSKIDMDVRDPHKCRCEGGSATCDDCGPGVLVSTPEPTNAIHLNSLGDPPLPPLSEGTLNLICSGLQIASQGTVKSMARELLGTRGQRKVGEW